MNDCQVHTDSFKPCPRPLFCQHHYSCCPMRHFFFFFLNLFWRFFSLVCGRSCGKGKIFECVFKTALGSKHRTWRLNGDESDTEIVRGRSDLLLFTCEVRKVVASARVYLQLLCFSCTCAWDKPTEIYCKMLQTQNYKLNLIDLGAFILFST